MGALQILLTAALISAAQLLLFTFCGAGMARLLLPAPLRAHELVLAPLFGLALLALLGFYGANAGLTMRQVLPVALALALALAFAAFWRRPRRPGLLPAHELAALLALCAACWMLSLLPVLRYRALLPIGSNWDIEFYLPLAEYLKDYSYRSLASAPPNPLLEIVRANPTFARAMGASYAQAMADLLGGWDSWSSWVPMLALLRALTLPGLYALLRVGLGVRAPGALAGVALAALNGLLLWTTYNSFGMGLGGLALLPAAVVCLLAALEIPSRRVIAGAGLLLGGLACTYWPMLMAYTVAGGGIGLTLLWARRHGDWAAMVGRGLLVLAVGGMLSLLAQLRAPAAFLGVFADQVASMGITAFISPATIAGAAPMPWADAAQSTPVQLVLAWAGLLTALALGALGVWYGSARRTLALGLAASILAYLAALQLIVQFPYGFVRGASYINTLLLGLAGAGVLARSRPGRRRLPAISAALALLLFSTTSIASYRTYAPYAERPALFSVEAAKLRADLAVLAKPGPLAISPAAATALCDTAFVPYAYALRARELAGVVKTGYALLRNPQPTRLPAYRMLARGEDQSEYGLDGATPAWQNDQVAIYETPAQQLDWLSGRTSGADQPPLCGGDVTTASRAQLGLGDYVEALPNLPLSLHAGAAALGWAPAPSVPAERGLALELASFTSQLVEVGVGAERRQIELPAGVSVYHIGAVSVPTTIALHPLDAPLVLRWASLENSSAPAALTAAERTVLLGWRSDIQAGGARVTLQTASVGAQLLRYAVEIYEDRPGYRDTPAHYAWGLFPAPAAGTHTVDLDLRTPRFALDRQVIPLQAGDLHDGAYFASLWVYQGEQVRGKLPLLRFERRNGQIENVTTLDRGAAFVALAQPRQVLDARFGDALKLRGVELNRDVARAGGQLQVSLLWQAEQPQSGQYLVFAQLLDASSRKIAQWDGLAGGDWWPPLGWRNGQQIWQDIPLQIAADAPPGRYQLIAGVYDPTTGARLRLADGADALLLGDIEVRP